MFSPRKWYPWPGAGSAIGCKQICCIHKHLYSAFVSWALELFCFEQDARFLRCVAPVKRRQPVSTSGTETLTRSGRVLPTQCKALKESLRLVTSTRQVPSLLKFVRNLRKTGNVSRNVIMATDPELKIAMFFDKGPKRDFVWVPVRCESELLPALGAVLHPETAGPDWERLGPKNARDLLAFVLSSIRINWEDIPDPGSTSTRKN